MGEVDTIFEHNEILDSVQGHMARHHLLVIGQHGTQHMDGRTGENVLSMMDIAQTPMLISKGTWQTPRNVLVAYDGSKGADKLIDFIAQHVQFQHLKCHILMAGKNHQSLDMALQTLRTAGINAQGYNTEQSCPLNALITRYEQNLNIDLLVMGTHGHSKFYRLFKGSTALSLIKATTRSILIVK